AGIRVLHVTGVQTCLFRSHGSGSGSVTGSSDVTVVVPTHRRNHFLPETIAAVVAQELAPAALVVSDDVGDPETRAIVEEWAGRRSEERRGGARRRARGRPS